MQNIAPVVLVYGPFGSQNDRQILEAFGDTPAFAPDMLGYGKHRDHNMRGLQPTDQAVPVANFIESLSQGPVHLVGHSVGGAIAT